MLKKIFYPLSLILCLSACEKDKNTDDDPNQNPQTDKRDAFVGDYSVRDSLFLPIGGLEEVKFYTLSIEKHSSPDSILISNLADTAWGMTAAFYDTSFYVSGQFIDASNSVYASGGGSFKGDSLFMDIASWRYSHRIDGEKQ